MNKMKLELEKVTLDEVIYPRTKRSDKLIEELVDALRVGAKLPPIEVQKVKILVEGEKEAKTKIILLDGWHRLEAYRRYCEQKGVKPIEEIEVVFWKPDEILDYKESLIDLMVRSAELNMKHGLRLSRGEAKLHLQKMAKLSENPLKISWKDMAKKFDVTPEWVSECVSEILAERRMSRDAFIYKLSLLGWTQQEIADVIEEINDRSAISKIVTELNKLNLVTQEDFYVKHKSIDEIAEYYHLDIPLTWAMVLEGKDDLERFKLFGDPKYQDDGPRLYNVWNFMECDPRLGYEHPGRIPGQIALSVLYYYTKQGDLVVDPMAGGGSTIDACLVMGRKCRAYDIKNEWEFKGATYSRKDVNIHDISNGFPDECKECNLIFLDPPYWRLEREFYVKESISQSPLDDWRRLMRDIATDSHSTLKEGGHVAVVVEAFLDELITGEFLDLPFECLEWFKDLGFKEIQRIGVPMPSQIKDELDVARYRKKKVLLDLNRDLIIFKKV